MGKLYEKCSLCKGTSILQGGEHCFGCKGTGFVEIGLTSGQVERAVNAERRRLGDPSAPAPDAVCDAAPDLLEACKATLEKLDYLQNLWSKEGVTSTIAEGLRAAIAKAEGGDT